MSTLTLPIPKNVAITLAQVARLNVAFMGCLVAMTLQQAIKCSGHLYTTVNSDVYESIKPYITDNPIHCPIRKRGQVKDALMTYFPFGYFSAGLLISLIVITAIKESYILVSVLGVLLSVLAVLMATPVIKICLHVSAPIDPVDPYPIDLEVDTPGHVEVVVRP